LVCTTFFAAIYGSFWGYGDSVLRTYVEAILFLPMHIFMSYAIIYFLLPRYLFTGQYLKLLAGIFILIPVTAFFSYLISQWFITPYRDTQGIPAPSKSLFLGLMAGLRGSNTVAGFAVAIKLVKHWYFKKEENAKLEKEKLRAELEVLKGQLHPHFLFNTLNNLYSLILQQSKQAPDVVLRLSSLLRYVLTESSEGKTSLSKELAILNHYISLEQIRFGDRLDLSLHVEGELENQLIAPLLLLPLVENAFKHGANEMLEQPWISLSAQVQGSQLKFKIINGKPVNHNGSHPYSSGIGLQNLRKRLALIYPNRHELRISHNSESFTGNLTIELDEHLVK
jgi:sensor histidine kinase YesM